MITTIESFEQFEKLINSDKGVVVRAWAPWSGPCYTIRNVYEHHANQHSEILIFAEFNVDEQVRIAQELGIRSMPTFIAFKNGQKIDELVGANFPGLESLILSLSER